MHEENQHAPLDGAMICDREGQILVGESAPLGLRPGVYICDRMPVSDARFFLHRRRENVVCLISGRPRRAMLVCCGCFGVEAISMICPLDALPAAIAAVPDHPRFSPEMEAIARRSREVSAAAAEAASIELIRTAAMCASTALMTGSRSACANCADLVSLLCRTAPLWGCEIDCAPLPALLIADCAVDGRAVCGILLCLARFLCRFSTEGVLHLTPTVERGGSRLFLSAQVAPCLPQGGTTLEMLAHAFPAAEELLLAYHLALRCGIPVVAAAHGEKILTFSFRTARDDPSLLGLKQPTPLTAVTGEAEAEEWCHLLLRAVSGET